MKPSSPYRVPRSLDKSLHCLYACADRRDEGSRDVRAGHDGEVEEVLARAGTDEARTMADALRRALLSRVRRRAGRRPCRPRLLPEVRLRGRRREARARPRRSPALVLQGLRAILRPQDRQGGRHVEAAPRDVDGLRGVLVCDRLTLRECAERVGVSLKTSFFMRHRLLEVYLSMF